jgi:heat shock protein HslJ
MEKIIYLSLCLTIAFAGCRTKKSFIPFSDLNGEWNIVELNGEKLFPEQAKQHLTFDTANHCLSGNAGCNQISGNIEYDKTQPNELKFQGIVSTRKACLDMRLEDEFLKALDTVVHFGSEDRSQPPKTVSFYDTDKRKVFVISRQ